MDLALLEELLTRKAAEYQRKGMPYPEAVSAAGEEILGQAARVLTGADLFCLRLCVHGARKHIRTDQGG